MPDLELRKDPMSVVCCQASAEALDALVTPGYGARACRTAPDEALFVAAPGVATDVAREIGDRVPPLDDDALVIDVTDAWEAFALTGPDARAAFAYLSALELPEEGFVQGDVAHVGAKVLADADGLLLLVPAPWGHHLWTRLLHDTGATETPA